MASIWLDWQRVFARSVTVSISCDSQLTESMLKIGQNFAGVEAIHDSAVYDMFEEFRKDACK